MRVWSIWSPQGQGSRGLGAQLVRSTKWNVPSQPKNRDSIQIFKEFRLRLTCTKLVTVTSKEALNTKSPSAATPADELDMYVKILRQTHKDEGQAQ